MPDKEISRTFFWMSQTEMLFLRACDSPGDTAVENVSYISKANLISEKVARDRRVVNNVRLKISDATSVWLFDDIPYYAAVKTVPLATTICAS